MQIDLNIKANILITMIPETYISLLQMYSKYVPDFMLQDSPIITLCLGSIELDLVISVIKRLFYKETRKVTIWELRPGRVITKTVL